MPIRVNGKDTQCEVSALIRHPRWLPKQLDKSLIRDRGRELADHQHFTLATEIRLLFL
jgi:IS30 family transposase